MFFFFLIYYYGNADTAKIQAHLTFVSRPPKYFSSGLFCSEQVFRQLSVLDRESARPRVLLLKKPPEWVVEVKESQQQVSDFSLLLSCSAYV